MSVERVNQLAEKTQEDCPFCDYRGPSEVLLHRNDVFFIEPMNPVIEGHVLAIPTQHVEDALADPEVTGSVMEAAAWFAAGECNLITSVGAAATQTVRHLHVHIVPRHAGDGLQLPWSTELLALAARATQMEADLLRYGNHTPSCQRRISKRRPCTCEWLDVLGAIAKAEFARAAVGEAAAASPSGEPEPIRVSPDPDLDNYPGLSEKQAAKKRREAGGS